MNPFSELMNETFKVVGANGAVKAESIRGRYADKEREIITFETAVAIVRGDHILRPVAAAHVEDYVVVDPVFQKGMGREIPDSYRLKVRRSDQPEAPPSTVIQRIVNNVSGANARVNVGSIDNSSNTVKSAQVFQDMKVAATSQIVDPGALRPILERIDRLEHAADTPDFPDRYNEFMASAASHMTVFTPFIPALTRFLTG